MSQQTSIFQAAKNLLSQDSFTSSCVTIKKPSGIFYLCRYPNNTISMYSADNQRLVKIYLPSSISRCLIIIDKPSRQVTFLLKALNIPDWAISALKQQSTVEIDLPSPKGN